MSIVLGVRGMGVNIGNIVLVLLSLYFSVEIDIIYVFLKINI